MFYSRSLGVSQGTSLSAFPCLHSDISWRNHPAPIVPLDGRTHTEAQTVILLHPLATVRRSGIGLELESILLEPISKCYWDC